MLESWKTSKTNGVMACLIIIATIKAAVLTHLIHSYVGVKSPDDLAYTAVNIPGVLTLGLISLALYVLCYLGLKRERPWALPMAAIIAILNLPTIVFPVSIAMGWFLLPDGWREEVLKEYRALKSK